MPGLKIIFTGSSLLHLHQAKADLSRRAVMYNMPGLSFREFLEFETKQHFDMVGFEDVLSNHVQLAIDLAGKIKPLAFFGNYLNFGYFPFYMENKETFHQKLSEVILTVLEIDIVQFASIPPQNIILLKRLLTIIGNSVPFKPNIKSLSEKTGISVNTLKVYLKLLNDAEMINQLFFENKGVNSLSKPEKIYINNSNLMVNLDAANANIGNMRETFFLNQVGQVKQIMSSPIADFLVDGKTFEIGGKNKTRKQIWETENAFVVKDDIEIGAGNSIPLWLFGFLY
jgi:predicted AAA+ superfamily ATPase